MSESCQTCPSYLGTDDVQSHFKKSIGAPMCARFGHVLGRPGAKPVQVKSLAEAFGSVCDSHGKPKPIDVPVKIAAQVSPGDPRITLGEKPNDDELSRVSTCHECMHFVQPSVVRENWGWTFGLCAMSGRLIFPQRVSHEAKACDWRSPGTNRTSMEGLVLAPAYDTAFEMDADPIAAYIAKRKRGEITWIDPTDYETDKPVESADADAGIRAWRRIDDPKGTGKFTFLPIYGLEKFDDAEREKIPVAGADEHPELYVDHSGAIYKVAILWRELDETPMLWGEAGTGKTELFRHLAWLMNLPFDRINLTAKSEVDDVIGKMLAQNASTYFQYGRIPRRWTRAGVLLLDEPNVAPDEIWQTIRPLTDNSKQLVIDQNGSEHLPRDADCYLGMACNPAWDVRNVGANTLADADGNRLSHLMMPMPPEPVERAILEDRCALDGWKPTDAEMTMVLGIAKEIRALCADGTLPISWGVRPQIKVVRSLQWFDPETAYRLAAADNLDPEQGAALLDVVKAHAPSTDDASVF